MEQKELVHNVHSVLARFHPQGINMAAFHFFYQIITGTKFPKRRINKRIQKMPGVYIDCHEELKKKKKRQQSSSPTYTVSIAKLTEQGYDEFRIKNPIQSSTINAGSIVSNDIPNHEILYSNDFDRIEARLLSLISKDVSPIIGFDTEWLPDISKKRPSKTALVQLAFEKDVVLIHLIHIPKIPPTLVEILKNPKYLKVCQDPRQDIDHLKKGYGLEVKGIVDLQAVAKRYGLKGGLNSIYSQLSGKKMNPKLNTLTDWEVIPLNKAQILYAAIDAIQSRESIILLHKNLANDMTKWIQSYAS